MRLAATRVQFEVFLAYLDPDPADQNQCESGLTTLSWCKPKDVKSLQELSSLTSLEDLSFKTNKERVVGPMAAHTEVLAPALAIKFPKQIHKLGTVGSEGGHCLFPEQEPTVPDSLKV
jgi:hypothetical protein